MGDINSVVDVFVAFRERCMWLESCYTTFASLYESGEERRDLLGLIAPGFFVEHNQVLQQHCILQACKLTDPAEMRGKKNLTLNYVNTMLRAANLLTPEIEALSAKMALYRELVLDSRHWIISHHDLEATMLGVPVGAHEREDWTVFLESMYRYTDAVGEAVGVGPLDYRRCAGPGDANDLLKHLRNSINHPAN